MKKKSQETPEINAASMADIAFLLLIFFLMVTTIETNEGIARKLPPMPDPNMTVDVTVNKRNVFEVRVNSSDQLLVEGEYATIKTLKDLTKRFILNYGKDRTLSDNPQEAVVSLKNDRGTSYEMYIKVQNELTAAYDEIRDAEARAKYGDLLANLTITQQDEIKDMFPMKVSEAEPEDIGGGK
ncbi:ExbD/TolR family protein [Bacteroidota bacterium]